MKSTFALAKAALFLSITLDSASAQPPHKLQHPSPKAKSLATGGVETITPQEPQSKDTGGAAGWNGSYVGVNAGMGFGATAGTNVIVPFGTSGKSDE
jgi:hypothetical protein